MHASRPVLSKTKEVGLCERQTYSPLEDFQVAWKETGGEAARTREDGLVDPLWCNRTEIVLLSAYDAGARAIICRGSMRTSNQKRQRRQSARNPSVTCNTLNPGWITSYAIRDIMRDVGRICQNVQPESPGLEINLKIFAFYIGGIARNYFGHLSCSDSQQYHQSIVIAGISEIFTQEN